MVKEKTIWGRNHKGSRGKITNGQDYIKFSLYPDNNKRADIMELNFLIMEFLRIKGYSVGVCGQEGRFARTGKHRGA